MSRAERRAQRREFAKTGMLALPKVVEKLTDIPWTPFLKTQLAPGEIEKLSLHGQDAYEGSYVNSRYQVLKFKTYNKTAEWPDMWWLSIRRQDREPIRDWRDLQRIKNELCGPENEGVEIFPAESRLMDTSNQYHMFVLKDAGIRFPFGVTNRAVLTPDQLAESGESSGAKQRAFEK